MQYDCVSLGEVMLRLDPGDRRIRSARCFAVWEGGGEYNVVRSLRKCFALRTAVVTALPDSEVGHLAEDLILQGGVDTSHIIWREYDGLGHKCRMGLNFTERGYGVRGALGVSDRGHSAASQMKPGDVDWEDIFFRQGARWFHTGGIFAALSPDTANLTLEGVRAAKAAGVTVSFDFNYRPSLWKNLGDPRAAETFFRELIPYVDVVFGGRNDFVQRLEVPVSAEASLAEVLERAALTYPNLRVIACTTRRVLSACRNDWGGMCYADGRLYRSRDYPDLEILDRIGGGDGFAAGLIYGLLTGMGIQQALEYGVAHGALVMTTPGDTSMASLSDVRKLVTGGPAEVLR